MEEQEASLRRHVGHSRIADDDCIGCCRQLDDLGLVADQNELLCRLHGASGKRGGRKQADRDSQYSKVKGHEITQLPHDVTIRRWLNDDGGVLNHPLIAPQERALRRARDISEKTR